MTAVASNNFGIYNNIGLNQAQLDSMYRFDWLAKKICDEPAKDATRKFIKVEDKSIKKMLDELKFRQACKKAASDGLDFTVVQASF